MKKNILTIGFCLATTFAFAQNHTDGLRYSMEELSGTARFKGMSGAFSSLGVIFPLSHRILQGVLFLPERSCLFLQGQPLLIIRPLP